MIHIVHQLRMASGSISKLRILRENFENEDWKKLLTACYNDSINYYVSAPRDNTFVDDFDTGDLLTALTNLSSRNVTGNAARAFALECSQTYGEMFRLVLGGSLKAGVSVTTINKAYPGLIAQFKVMLAKDSPITHFPCIASTKYDGVRLLAFVEEPKLSHLKHKEYTMPMVPDVKLILRSGKQIHIKSLEYEMSKQPPGVYDGELVSGDGLQEGRTKITGSVNRCLKGSDTDIKGYTYCIFDMLEHAEWDEQQTSRPYSTRITAMNDGLTQNVKVRMAEMYMMTDMSMVNNLYANLIKKGYEGLIIRYAYDFYEWKRSEKLIKLKVTNECVLTCVGTTEGTGKYEGMIGALQCRGTVDGKLIVVKLGSGLTDHDREMSPSHYEAKQIDVLYNDIVRAEGADHYSLFLPRFKRVAGEHNV